MKMSRLLALLFPLIASIGCTGGNAPSADGRAYMLDVEPASAMGVIELRQRLSPELVPLAAGAGLTSDEVASPTEPSDANQPAVPESLGEVSMVGRVGGPEDEEWDTTQAVFLLRDMSVQFDSHDHGGKQDNCKFCQQARADAIGSLALVQIVDAQGNVVPADPRELLGLQENHIVVVTGQANIDSAGTFVFSANKLYIRP